MDQYCISHSYTDLCTHCAHILYCVVMYIYSIVYACIKTYSDLSIQN